MRVYLLCLLATTAACAQTPAPPNASIDRPTQTTATTTGALTRTAAPSSIEGGKAGGVLRVRKAIDWTAADAHPRLSDALTSIQGQILRRAKLPVLLPGGGPWTAVGIATGEADWYALSSPVDDLTVVIQGDRMATVDPEMVPSDWSPPTWRQPLLTRNEGIVEATFLAFGASYAVSVECALPDRDVRCTQDAFVLKLVDELRLWSLPGEVSP